MMYSKIEAAAAKISAPAAKEYGYDIYDINYVKEGPHLFLRIFITRDDGVTLDDCEEISRRISKELDDQNCIESNYFLEVSSPGIERALRQDVHFENAVNEKIHLKLYSALGGVKELEGVLTGCSGAEIIVETDIGKITVQKKNIAKANVVFDF